MSNVLISVIFLLLTAAKYQLEAPVIVEIFMTKYKLNFNQLGFDTFLLLILFLAAKNYKQMLSVFLYYKLYFEPLRMIVRAKLALFPPLLLNTETKQIQLKQLMEVNDRNL